MTKRSNILAKVSLRDGLVSSWGEVRFGNSSNQQEKQTESRFVSLQTPRLIAGKAHNTLMYSQLPPPTHTPRTAHNCWQKSYPQSHYQLATRGGQFKDKIISHVGMLISRAALCHFVPTSLDGVALSQRCGTSVFTTKTNHQSLNNSR